MHIHISEENSYAATVVKVALQRSFGVWDTSNSSSIHFFISPSTEEELEAFSKACKVGSKIVVFGSPENLPPLFTGLHENLTRIELQDLGACPPSSEVQPSVSAGHVSYVNHPLTEDLSASIRTRPFCRYDFTDEWNNLGYGKILTDESCWGVKNTYRNQEAIELGSIQCQSASEAPSTYIGPYFTLNDTPTASVLWCPRAVGPVDSTEWAIVERFISDWRYPELPCHPCIMQTPWGVSAIATMRLDCDEAVSSSNHLFEWYRQQGIPFSLAIKSDLQFSKDDLFMLEAVLEAGGTILSHSHTHLPNWGKDKEQAFAEAITSSQIIEGLCLQRPSLAVSPFHMNPPYAMQALAEAGISGVVSGIIHNDPEYLLGRAGRVPFVEDALQFISISQQSMLHGDTFNAQNGVDVHIAGFEIQHQANGIFGYLDHPFSGRYQYGWQDKAQQLVGHQLLIEAIRSFPNTCFWNQETCFEFVKSCSATSFTLKNNKVTNIRLSGSAPATMQYRFNNKLVPIEA